MLAGERPGRGTTPGTGAELNDATYDSTLGRTDEGLGRDRPIIRIPLEVPHEVLGPEPWPTRHGVVIAAGPGAGPRRAGHRLVGSHDGLTGRRTRRIRPHRPALGPKPLDDPPGRCEL